MPVGPDARRLAASSELRAAVAAIGCALDLLASSAPGPKERQLLGAIEDELGQIRRAVQLLE
jgi:hypothetical protein